MLTKMTTARKMAVAADTAWQAIRTAERLDVWFQGISSCIVEGEGVGAVRRLTLEIGGNITDNIIDIVPAKRRLVYQRIESPFPVHSYRGTVEVFESYDSLAVVAWTVDFESEAKDSEPVAELLRTGISAGLEGMEQDLASG